MELTTKLDKFYTGKKERAAALFYAGRKIYVLRPVVMTTFPLWAVTDTGEIAKEVPFLLSKSR